MRRAGPAHAETAEVRIGNRVVHPYRVAVPEMAPKHYAHLVAAVRQAGEPTAWVTVDREGRVVDGRAQLRACLEVGVEPKVEVTNRTDIATIVLGSMSGTPYTKAQCVLVAARLMEPLAAEARARQSAGSRVREKFPKGKAADIAARAVPGTNGKWVAKARKLLAQYPEVVALIDAGTLPRMTQALELAALDGSKRRKAVQRLRAGEEPALVLLKPKARDDLWLTPPDIVAAVRAAFDGEIVCDPCAPVGGGSFVDAAHAYTQDDDGLDPANPWYDRTFVNPPFSNSKPWIKRAISEAQDGKRVYLLLAVHPGSPHQAALIEAAIDVLFLEGHITFGKPGAKVAGPGRNAIMIVGLLCSTRPLVAMGIAGMVVSRSGRDPSPEDAAAEAAWRETEIEPASSALSAQELEDAERGLRAQAEQDARMVEAGRHAVAAVRKEISATEPARAQLVPER